MCKLVTNATILLRTKTLFVKDSIQDGGEGDMRLVKLAWVNNQTCHKRTILLKTRTLFVRSVTLGSDSMNGRKLILSPLDNTVAYSGKEILQTEES